MKKGKHFERNLEKLQSIPSTEREQEWAIAIKICQNHVNLRLRKRTLFGAHCEENLGMDPVDYYVGYAYDAIIDGHWEWKDGRTLAEQMLRIADNRIGKEVEKYSGKEKVLYSADGKNLDDFFYSSDPLPGEPTHVQESVFSKQIEILEEAVHGDENLEMFWECIKEGMKREEIAEFMDKQPKQIDKLREKLINKIKASSQFQLE